MQDFTRFFRMNAEDARRYAVEVLHYFAPGEETDCAEIGDGNINYVYRLTSRRDGRSLIIKQADRLLRSSGRPLDPDRSRIEAMALRIEGELVPGFVPEVYHYDAVMAAIAMEDVSAYKNLRTELREDRVYPHLAENLSKFLAGTLLPTTDLVLDSAEKKRRVQRFINPELCFITEDLVLSEPYLAIPFFERNKNIITPGNEAYVAERLTGNRALHAQAAMLRVNFMNNAQALLHGDLHTGSVFANADGIRVLDPEFAFYGPMGYDIGNVIGNLLFAWGGKVFTRPEETATAEALAATVADTLDLTGKKLAEKYDALVTFPLYRGEEFKTAFLAGVMADALGYAGTELIRRTVGDAKVEEVTAVTDPTRRIPMERVFIEMGIYLIMNREHITAGREVTEEFCRLLSARGKEN